ncbi:MAG: restriction endonuclease [Thermoplasmata archaeon]|nr:MAG: restriction endonuclease [Thermoplasmata archaeon]
MKSQRFWVVRVPKGDEVIKSIKNKGIVAVGFRITESIANVIDRERIKELYRSARPDATEPRVAVAAGQLYRIAQVIKDGDWILTPNRSTRSILYGRVKGDYVFLKDAIGPGYSHAREVEWLGEFSRDQMSAPLRNSIGGISTVLNMDKHGAELLRLMNQNSGGDEPPDEVDGEGLSFYDETKAQADELIADLLNKIDPYDFQELVAGLIQAMGYRTRVSEKGPDEGIDIVAHPDVLGFERPRIKVQVKHRQSAVGGPDIRNLAGTLSEGERGLLVSTGGFTKQALSEAKGKPNLTLLDSDEFVDLLTEYYDRLDSDYRSFVPLRKIWVPVLPK